ncbi:MAG: Uma2 family endonuclease [Thermomicrobiales bacterium]
MTITTRLFTVEDLAKMPGDEPWELWEGELRQVPGAGGMASGLAGRILVMLSLYVWPRDLGWVTGADGTFVLGRNPDTVVVPDVAFVRWERLPERRPPDTYIPVPPDLAVEVLSPSDGPRDIAAKMERYTRAGVPLVWWVHPKRRTVAVYHGGQLVAELREGDELDGGDVLPGFGLPVAEIFAGV